MGVNSLISHSVNGGGAVKDSSSPEGSPESNRREKYFSTNSSGEANVSCSVLIRNIDYNYLNIRLFTWPFANLFVS